MTIRMKTLSAGPDGVRLPGSKHDLSKAEEQALVDGNYAEFVRSPMPKSTPTPSSPPAEPELETATAPVPPATTATAPATPGKRKKK